MMVSVFVSSVILYTVSLFYFFFFKQKTAYEMRISDWSSDVCSSDLAPAARAMYRIWIWSGRTSRRSIRASTTSKPWSLRSRSREWRAEGARIKPDAPDRVRLRQFLGVAFANRLRDVSAQPGASGGESFHPFDIAVPGSPIVIAIGDRKSTRMNSSH